MDIQHYTVQKIGDTTFVLLPSLENPFNLIICEVIISDIIYKNNGNRIYYNCEHVDFINGNEYLDKYLFNKSFNVVSTENGHIRDKTFKYERSEGMNINYNMQHFNKYSKFLYHVPIPMALSTKELAIQMLEECEDATIIFFNNIINDFDFDKKYK